MYKGKIVEMESSKELMNVSGVYSKLVEKQTSKLKELFDIYQLHSNHK